MTLRRSRSRLGQTGADQRVVHACELYGGLAVRLPACQHKENGGGVVGEPVVSDRVLTLPNVLSVLRLVGVPVFLWAILAEHDVLALVVLMLSGLTDYLDGKIARRFGLESRLGQLLDPFADRLYIAHDAARPGAGATSSRGGWSSPSSVARCCSRACSGGSSATARPGCRCTSSARPPPSTCSTRSRCCCSVRARAPSPTWALPIGWAFAWWGTVLYWVAGVMYIVQARQVVAAHTVPAT